MYILAALFAVDIGASLADLTTAVPTMSFRLVAAESLRAVYMFMLGSFCYSRFFDGCQRLVSQSIPSATIVALADLSNLISALDVRRTRPSDRLISLHYSLMLAQSLLA